MVASAVPWTASTLTGRVAGWQSAGFSKVEPARLTIAVISSDASHAIRNDMNPPFEWPIR
jgi:hypothetical protein